MKNTRYYPYERNRYFYGKLLTVRDFELEQKYFNDKRRLTNRLLHGSGVVCGLQVVRVDDKTISVETGVAVDYAGREIVVASPVTQKLSMIEGFTNNEYAKNVYLCIAYDEKEKEPVYSVAGSSTRPDEVSEYNRYQETFRLFVKEEPPDPADFGFAQLLEDISLLYEDQQVRVWQKVPRFVTRGSDAIITLRVEKTLQTPRIELEYGLASDYFTLLDGGSDFKLSFAEPEIGQNSEYEVQYVLQPGNNPVTLDKIRIKDRSLKVKIGDKELNPDIDCASNIQIIEGPVYDQVMHEYLELSLDQVIEGHSESGIYLAKINLLQVGPTFSIEKIDQVPFGEYCYNVSDLFRLGLLPKDDVSHGAFSAKATAVVLAHDADPNLTVAYNPREREFDFKLGMPLDRRVLEAWKTGVVELELDPNSKNGKSYFSEEIEHGLGLGPVLIMTGLEGKTSDFSQELAQTNEQLVFGDLDVFEKSPYESLVPKVSIGTLAYPQRGSFRIGVKVLSQKLERVTIRWWAYQRYDEGKQE